MKKYIGLTLCSIAIQAVCAHPTINLSDTDIKIIYNKFVKPNFTEEYKMRYVPLPVEKNNKPWRWENKDFPRIISLLEFERFVVANNLSSQKGLALNGIDPEWQYLPKKQIVHIDYVADPRNNNLQTLNLKDKDFDFVMVNQTLEHLYDPITCLKNIYAHMKRGGILYLNVPANSILHEVPFHYYTGYTPVGIGAVVQAAGFELLSIGQWGNWEYMSTMFQTQGWPDYRALKNPGINEVKFPVITWVFAIK